MAHSGVGRYAPECRLLRGQADWFCRSCPISDVGNVLISLRHQPLFGSSSLTAIARVILLNGVGSAGKSLIARALQELQSNLFRMSRWILFWQCFPRNIAATPGHLHLQD